MGWFSGITKGVKKIFNKVVNFVKKIVKFIKKILPVLIIVLIVFAPYLAGILATYLGALSPALALAYTALGGWVAAAGFWVSLAVATVTSYLVLPDETTEVIRSVGDAVVGVATEVGTVTGDVVGAGLGGVATGIFGAITSNPLLLVGVVAVGVLLLGGSDESEVTIKQDPYKDEYDRMKARNLQYEKN